MKCGAREERAAESIFRFSGAGWVKAQTAENEPSCHGAGVFVAREGLRSVELLHHLPNPVARAVRATRRCEEIQHMVYRLIALCVLAKGHGGHLRHLMNLLPIYSYVEVGRHGQHLLQGDDCLLVSA